MADKLQAARLACADRCAERGDVPCHQLHASGDVPGEWRPCDHCSKAELRQGWDAKLGVGEEFERRCINLLGLEGIEAKKSPVRAWDIQFAMGARTWKIECKHDGKALYSGNLYFETECRGKPSGVRASQADYWMHGIGMSPVYLFRRKELVEFLDRALEDGVARYVQNGGDDGGSSGILLPVSLAMKVPHAREFF